MRDLREKIRKIIENETKLGNFSILGSDEHVDLIQQIIENYEVTNDLGKEKASNPETGKKEGELVFVAAPTGAGKDSLVVKMNHCNPDKKYIELNMDIFRQYFPMFIDENIDNMTDKNFAKKTNEFSYEIYKTIQELILEEFPGTNVIITGTLRDTDWVEEAFKKFKSNDKTDYKVKLACLAVSKKVSAISVIYRYVGIVDSQGEKLKEYPGSARYTSASYHDETYERFPDNFSYFQNEFLRNPGELIDSIEVYKRSKNIQDLDEDTLCYSSDLDKESERSALDVIMELRNSDEKIDNEKFSEIAKKIIKNKDYLKSQGTLKEIIKELAIILDYPKIIERLDKLDSRKDGPNLE